MIDSSANTKLYAAFLKWMDGDAITPQELASLTEVFTRLPPISTANPQEVLAIMSRYAGNVAMLNQNVQQTAGTPPTQS